MIKEVVAENMCVGCGVCAAFSDDSLQMQWNKYGFLVPTISNTTDSQIENKVIKLCPFNPNPEKDVMTEDNIAELFQSNVSHYHKDVGKYESVYAGHSNEYRLTSSSGGMATFVFSELLNQKIVDALIVVRLDKQSKFYEYQWISTMEELERSSKTRYFPVTMSKVLKKVDAYSGKVGIVGVGCFIKSIRLLQHYKPRYKNKITFLVGIICGGLKSKYYSDYLAYETFKKGVNYRKPDFRIKDINSTALDYSFGAEKNNSKEMHTVKMKNLGDMWGTGLFKAKACDFCEDVTTELADISLGDAWIEPYKKDGKGNSIVITRSALANDIILDGIETKKLTLDKIDVNELKKSQSGSYNHRHKGLKFRISAYGLLGGTKQFPPKRSRNLNEINFLLKIIQVLRIITRKCSLFFWLKFSNQKTYAFLMFPLLKGLGFFSKINRKFK